MTTNISTLPDRRSPSRSVAAEIRAELGRRGMSQRAFAARLGVQQPWLSRRIGVTADVDLTFEEILEMAKALSLSAQRLLDLLEYAIRDSNPEPSD